MPTAVFDPGVLVSAMIAPSGTCGQLLETVVNRRCAMLVCPLRLSDYLAVLMRAHAAIKELNACRDALPGIVSRVNTARKTTGNRSRFVPTYLPRSPPLQQLAEHDADPCVERCVFL